MAEYSRYELERISQPIPSLGWTRKNVKDWIDSLWRDPVLLRWSGFFNTGGPDAVINWSNATKIFSIEPLDKKFAYFQFRNKLSHHIVNEKHEVDLSAVIAEGLYIFYFGFNVVTGEQELQYLFNPTEDEIREVELYRVEVARMYWNANAGEALHFGDDRHGSEWNPQIQRFLHYGLGAQIKEGLYIQNIIVNGDGSSNTHAQFSVSEGTMMHDDFDMDIPASSNTIPILYFSGGLPRYLSQSGYAVYKGASRLCYNKNRSLVNECTNGYFVIYHIFATNELISSSKKVVSVMGLNEYETIGDAYQNADAEYIQLRQYMPQNGKCFIGSVILETSDDFTNTIKARVVGVIGSELSHPPVSIHKESTDYLEIDEKQILKLNVEALLSDPFQMRWSGFYNAGGPDTVISWNDSTKIFSIAPQNTNYDIFLFTTKVSIFTISAEHTIDLSEVIAGGLYIFYFEYNSGTGLPELKYLHNPTADEIRDIELTKAEVARMFWNATAQKAYHFGDNRFGSEWNPQIQRFLHYGLGAQIKNGLYFVNMIVNGDGSFDAHAKFSISEGTILHDDFEMEIPASSYTIPIAYFLNGLYAYSYKTGFSVYQHTTRLAYNNNLTSLAECSEGFFVIYHYFATNELLAADMKIISVMGLNQYETLGEAFQNADNEYIQLKQYLPQNGLAHIGSVIFQTSDTYENNINARVVGMIGENVSHPPVSIDEDSKELLEIDEKQVLKFKAENLPAMSGVSSYTYIAYASDASGTGFTMTFNAALDYIAIKTTTAPIANPQASNFTGLWKKYKGEPGTDGSDGTDGADGDSSYTYIAYASDASGTGFTTTFNAALDYVAIKAITSPIDTPQASDFTGLWKKYKGEPGADGQDGTSVKILGNVSTSTSLPGYPSSYGGDVGDGYITDDTGHLWVWSGSIWVDAGNITGPAGADGQDGADGDSSYTYIAYASNASGANFTTTFNASLDYIAIKTTTSPIASPSASDFTGLWKKYKGEPGVDGSDGDDGASSYTYIAYASDASGTGFTNIFNAALDYIAILTTTAPIASPQASDFTGLWKKYKGEPGADGSDGTDGADGDSSYTYIAYASDASGTGFTTTFNAALDYVAIKATTSPIASPQASDFTGLWKKYKGEPGADGQDGTSVVILGSVTTSTNLPGYPSSYGGDVGDGYITSDTGHLWVWSGSTWVDAGNITGPAGEDGQDGADGDSSYTYIAYASNTSGANFTTTFNAALDYIAIRTTTTPIASPTASHFSGLWKKYKGEPGTDGSDGVDGAGYKATSTTYVSIATGTRVFTTQAGLAYSVGARVRISYASIPSRYMEGIVTAYSVTSLSVSVDKISGSGSYALWNINLAGDVGSAGADGDDGAPGADGAKWYSGTSVPTAAIGVQGDFYLLKGQNWVYKKTTASSWDFQTNLTGEPGEDGVSSYTYVAYASDASGTGFTTTFNAALDYIAIKTTTSPIASPSASDFTGLWKKYKGEPGADGSDAPGYWTDKGAYLHPTDNERISIGKTTNVGNNVEVNGNISFQDFLSLNCYYSSGWKFISTGYAMLMKQESSSFAIYVSTTSGSAGGAITWKQVTIANASGNITATNFVLSSERRLKSNISPIQNIEKFDEIKIKQFNFKNDVNRLRYGVIVDEVEHIAPEIVHTENGDKTVAYIDLLLAKVARLEQIIETMKKK